MIIWIGGAIIHGKGWNGKATRRILNPGYAAQGEWKAYPAVLERRVRKPFEVHGWLRKAGIWMVMVGDGPRLGQAHIAERAWAVVGLC